MAARVLRSCLKDASFNKLKLRCGVGPRRCNTASEAAARAGLIYISRMIDVTWCSAR
ncbi:hypothetical protein BHE74_00037961 [Ensete ventricosum]|uniref:Uncharacterized protein n=1 Tax=Ensete ventricosum TaxID=4639 RepID=A0A426XDJ9_ENSVE|nr:hypothetical protein B296_00045252 [Ensete ventricosum]RWV86494.1 hypothetical protein GW17_00051608 [Ensete ventricosum]RWW55405.1 hypothetical protein BHE74_00037961 [Ensete ventricosum]RZS20872.1 hypothetical protein BHM03_00053446 [Ensete ventricosum]